MLRLAVLFSLFYFIAIWYCLGSCWLLDCTVLLVYAPALAVVLFCRRVVHNLLKSME